MKPIISKILMYTLCSTLLPLTGNACEVKSDTATAAVVELYTSEGCSSCPPAEEQFNQLRRKVGPNAVLVPLALHVTYWDQIGWKDPFAQTLFDQRQSRLLANRKNNTVYTPQFFVNGVEVRNWSGNLPDTVKQINRQRAPLTMTLNTMTGLNRTVTIEANAMAPNLQLEGNLYVALSESGLVSKVLRGENSGVTLNHEDTVRLWLGPVQLTNGNARLRHDITLPADWNLQRLQAVAFVQDQGAGNVLQAVSTGQCKLTPAI